LRGRGRKARLWIAALCVAALAAALAAPAGADYEQAKYEGAYEHFGVGGEAEQLYNSRAIAINESGAGLPAGEAGSFYVVGLNARVVRYLPGEEGEEPEFREAWGWGAVNEFAAEFQRCGPAVEEETGEAAHCAPPKGIASFAPDEEPFQYGHFNSPGGVAVDQATGNVYVLNKQTIGRRERNLVEAFTAAGTGIAHFGEIASGTIAESPGKIHNLLVETEIAIAVDEAGTVYLTDKDGSQSRAMSFEPETPGDYEHYVYAGQTHDITTTYAQWFSRLALVGGDRIVVGGRELIREYPLAAGGEPQSSEPLCTYLMPSGVQNGMTADPLTGEVFYFAGNPDRKLHRLGPCDEETGEFKEIQASIAPSPKTHSLALAINPTRAWGPLRPAGTLYAADSGVSLEPPKYSGIGDVFVPAPLNAPEILSEWVANATTGSAGLRATIDPRGHTTRYRFEYLPAATYQAQKAAAEGEGKSGEEAEDAGFAGAIVTPSKEGTIGSGEAASAAATASGLSPDTAYRFRAVATSECKGEGEGPCVVKGEAASFATYPPPGATPPDDRAYELVSPTQKHGGEAFPADPGQNSCSSGECKPPGTAAIVSVFPMQSAPDGNALTYMGYAFSPNQGAAVYNSYLSRRTASGWQTSFLSPALLATSGGENLAVSAGLGRGLIYQPGSSPRLSEDAPSGYTNLYAQDTGNPTALAALVSTVPPNRSAGAFAIDYAGHSPDFSCRLFAANDALTAATPDAPPAPDPGSAGRELYQWCEGRLSLVNVLPGNAAVATGAKFAAPNVFALGSPDIHAVSQDGSKVFFEAGGSVYVRIDGAETVKLAHSGTFLAANAAGTQVLFADGCLYSLASKACTDLTGGEGGFQGIAGASEDLSRIYFVATAALPGSGENERGEEAEEGKPNLYFREAGSPTRFIATLLAGDGLAEGLGDWAAAPAQRGAEASPGGRYLAFASKAPLTGYDNTGPCGKAVNPEIEKEPENEYVTVPAPCTEAFLYDSATGRLRCVSCNPSGEAPLGPSTLRRIDSERSWQSQPRYLTDSGRLFFDSQDRLSARDTNGRVEDVYEYEPNGVGSCTRAEGCVSLITPGTGAVDSNFLAADSSGANVFFTARERLLPSDIDELIDVYDAREGGGFAAAESESQRAECLGEACQPSSGPPATPTPASAAFAGAGNLSEAGSPPAARRCPKGKRKVKRRGKTRCVKKSHKRKRHHKRSKRHAGTERRAGR
jgi:hypothetical protein